MYLRSLAGIYLNITINGDIMNWIEVISQPVLMVLGEIGRAHV